MNIYSFDSVSSVNLNLGEGIYHNIHFEIIRSIDQIGEKKKFGLKTRTCLNSKF